jgi:hypothetical protein
MPDKSPPEFPPSQDPAKPETSLADLLPDLFETPPAPQNSPPSGPPPLPPRQKFAIFLPLIIAAVIGMIIVPLIIVGVFIFIANSQPVPSTIDVVKANTPLATVFSITPVPSARPTPPGSPAPAKSAGASQCPPQTAFGLVAYYSCSQPVQAGSAFTAYFGLAELQLAQNGQNGPGATRLYSVTGDSPAKVLQFYAASLAAQGYTPSNPTATGATPLGPYSAALYAKGTQQVQVMALTVNKASPDGQVKAGQTLIRLSSS